MIKLLGIAHQVLEEQHTNESFKKKALAATIAAATALGTVNTGLPTKNQPRIEIPGAVEMDSNFSYIDLSTDKGIEQYAKICQAFIDTRSPNPLGITGNMMAQAAAAVYSTKYIPPELALAQLVVEGGIGNNDETSRPIVNNNPYNIGNVDTGRNQKFSSVSDAIKAYYKLMATDYLPGKRSPNDLLKNFVNTVGNRYASAPNYETMLKSVTKSANNIAKKVIKNWQSK